MRSSRKTTRDRLIVLGCLLLGVLCFVVLWSPNWSFLTESGPSSENAIGTLTQEQGDVRKKAAGEIAWQDLLQKRSNVSNGDSIYTGPEGKAELNLGAGQRLTIFPSSMILVQAQPSEARKKPWFKRLFSGLAREQGPKQITLKSGELHLDHLSPGQPIELEANGTRFALKAQENGASVDVSLGPKNQLTVVSASGKQVSLVSLPPESAPQAGEAREKAISFETGTITRLSVQAEPASTRLFDDQHFNYIPVSLRWNAVPGAASYRVILNHGKEQVFDQTVDKTAFQMKLTRLDKTAYFYQVLAVLKSGVNIASEKTKLDSSIVPPQITLPESRDVRKDVRLLIAWERTLLTSTYRVQIAKDAEFRQLRVDRDSRLNAMPFTFGKAGTYYVRVKSISRDWESVWSTPRLFQVN